MADRFRFGEFEFNIASGELRKSGAGEAERLPPQPARLLQLLVERSGAIVTREEIRERLWGNTHVDFDTSLHFCVRQLRVALGDSGVAPRYVQNVPRRGYRLVPAVTRVGDDHVPVVPPAAARRWTPVAIVLLVAVIVGTFLVSQSNRETPRVRIAIMPFEASIAEWVVAELSTSAGDSVGVVGPTTTAAYGRSNADLRRLAADYRIDYIVNARDLGADRGPGLLAELIRVSDGVHVWVRPYDDLSDGRRLGREIGDNVVRVLKLRAAD
ncbi:MAG: winged helix-turn-helix domain-containing protein [Vicinamibacterales bacterium]